MTGGPTVTVAIPTLNEEAHIDACLDAIERQTYPHIVEVLVVDGRSTDRTRELAGRRSDVVVVDNPRRIQAAALNIALDRARGDVFVRVDGHCVLADDYVERCVEALERTGAAMVGGAMTPVADGWVQKGIAAAMSSSLGAGPARFHTGGRPSWVDTVYLGAYPVELARKVSGYSEDVGVNEDAELAIRLRPHGGIWFDPSIRSLYSPRSTLRGLCRQFYRYGRSRAATIRRHPTAVAPRQLAAPALVLALVSPWRRQVAFGYVALVASRGTLEMRSSSTPAAAGLVVAIPIMHFSWAAGFFRGLAPTRREPSGPRGAIVGREGRRG